MTERQHKHLEDFRGEIRNEVIDAHLRAWDWIARPGTWLTGAQRCAVAHEVRLARTCRLCIARKEALSPAAITGQHDDAGVLDDAHVEAIHKLASDPGRLSKGWLDDLLSRGLDDGAYVESAGIVAMVSTMDAFTWSLGLEPAPVPEPCEGEPSRYRPPGARINDVWVATINPGDQVESDGPVYGLRASGVHRALSLVPASKMAAFDLLMAHYISLNAVASGATADLDRAITRPQIEIVASRVSVLNQCLF